MYSHPKSMGHAFVHTVIDDHSRVAYAEIHDETAVTAATVLRNAVAWFAAREITVQRVLSDNGSAYVSHLWRDTCAQLRDQTLPHPALLGHRPTRKIERFHRTLSDGWGYARCYTSETERRQALPAWLHQ